MLKKLLLFLGSLTIGALALSLVTLLKQDLPLLDPPGLWLRLGVYLSTNVAETVPDSMFGELAPVYVRADPDLIIENIRVACRRLGWTRIRSEPKTRRVEALATSRWLGFKDDIQVNLSSATTGSWRLDIRSAARLGQADFGVNERHILDLLAMLRQMGLDLAPVP